MSGPIEMSLLLDPVVSTGSHRQPVRKPLFSDDGRCAMALTDTAVRLARPTGNDYTRGDTDGLALFVGAAGRQELAPPRKPAFAYKLRPMQPCHVRRGAPPYDRSRRTASVTWTLCAGSVVSNSGGHLRDERRPYCGTREPRSDRFDADSSGS
jgi:hypothetical protein